MNISDRRDLLSGAQVSDFLTAGPIFVFEPDTLEPVAQVSYRQDGSVLMKTVDCQSDVGAWGISANTYWTQYEKFRDGERYHFGLEYICDDTMQAYFSDGRRAYLQSHRSKLVPAT